MIDPKIEEPTRDMLGHAVRGTRSRKPSKSRPGSQRSRPRAPAPLSQKPRPQGPQLRSEAKPPASLNHATGCLDVLGAQAVNCSHCFNGKINHNRSPG